LNIAVGGGGARHEGAGLRVAVIGAGMAGLACARALEQAGAQVVVFDKGRGVGGRLATRTTPWGGFDHGAQYFTVQTSAFDPVVAGWAAAGLITPWQGRLVALSSGRLIERTLSAQRFVGRPGMQSLPDHLARGLDVRLLVPIDRLSRTAAGWRLIDTAGGTVGLSTFDAVCLAVPSPQATQLLRGVSALADACASVAWEPCWATLVALERPCGVEFDGAFVNDDPILGWIARDSTKPDRPLTDGVGERWVLHARPRWSREYLDMPEDEVAHWMLRAFVARLGRVLVQPRAISLLWPCATPSNPLAQACLWDPRQRVGAAGDWCGGPRVEGAWLSGLALAAAVTAAVMA
jgi:renalase